MATTKDWKNYTLKALSKEEKSWTYIKSIYGHCDIDARDFFDFSINNNNTRTNGLKLRPEKCRYNIRKNLFSNRIVEAWNNLSRTAVTAQNTASIKREIGKEMQY